MLSLSGHTLVNSLSSAQNLACTEVRNPYSHHFTTCICNADTTFGHHTRGGEAGYEPSHLIRRHMTSQATRKEFTQQPTKQILAEVRRNDGFRRNLAS